MFFGKIVDYWYIYRGNSKYHYYGIRVKPGSILNQLSEDGTSIATRPQTGSQKRYKFVPGSSQKNADSQYDQTVTNSSSQHSSPNTLNVSTYLHFYSGRHTTFIKSVNTKAFHKL